LYIESLRNISRLEFNLPDRGIWLLTAGNGAGKTSLLACLRRIGYPNAFPVHFPSSIESTNLDNYSKARIVYRIDDDEVEYAYRGERWAPRPRRNSSLLDQFGYPSVVYVGATADRITPRPEDFSSKRIKNAPATLIAAANHIFETKKFDDLRIVNLKKGGGNRAFVLRVAQNPAQYHSEKQFSLGELCVLKLITQLEDCPHQSLVLIDELEIALHPRAQVQLYKFLRTMAEKKQLTVIFSTHSVTLLKSVPHSEIIFLERDKKGQVVPIVACFPTYAVGNITLGEERAPDVVFYVEDEVARAIVEPLVKLTVQRKYQNDSLFPVVKTVPIGGFEAVVNFLNQHAAVLPSGTKAHALLDNDVKSEVVAAWQKNNNFGRLKKLEDVKDQVDYLPWTPEVGIVEYLCDREQDAEADLRRHFSDNQISLDANIFDEFLKVAGKDRRQIAKQIFRGLCSEISKLTAKPYEFAEKGICEVFAKNYFGSNSDKILRLLGAKLS
jgi:ABC-type multidrug transport system ATPase subunit